MKKTLVMGASTKPDRYAYMAAERLLKHDVEIELLGRRAGEVLGNAIHTEKEEVGKDVHTVTMYLSEKNQEELEDFISSLKPQRVIFNPGAENPEFQKRLEEEGVEVIEGCTLVMLGTGQF